MSQKYSITTQVCGNIDHGQDPTVPPYGVDIVELSGHDLETLHNKVRDWIDDNDIGGGNWMNPALRANGKVIGYMSYNSCIWTSSSCTASLDTSML